VVQTNDVFIFCPDYRNHVMLHEAIRCPIGEPGDRSVMSLTDPPEPKLLFKASKARKYNLI